MGVYDVKADAKNNGDFALHDLAIFLLLRLSFHSLPREFAVSQEVDEDVSERLEVVATALLDAQMITDGRVPRRSDEPLILVVSTITVLKESYGICAFVME